MNKNKLPPKEQYKQAYSLYRYLQIDWDDDYCKVPWSKASKTQDESAELYDFSSSILGAVMVSYYLAQEVDPDAKYYIGSKRYTLHSSKYVGRYRNKYLDKLKAFEEKRQVQAQKQKYYKTLSKDEYDKVRHLLD